MRTPAWQKYLDGGLCDLFRPTNDPRDLAISQVIDNAVDSWIKLDMDSATHMVKLADKYQSAPNSLFERESSCSM